ncbi:MAG: hypothetical protein PVJ20_13645, partial [Desulfobacterales bacterium]
LFAFAGNPAACWSKTEIPPNGVVAERRSRSFAGWSETEIPPSGAAVASFWKGIHKLKLVRFAHPAKRNHVLLSYKPTVEASNTDPCPWASIGRL